MSAAKSTMSAAKSSMPSPTIASRIDACRTEMKKGGCSAYLITEHVDTFYMTGFSGEDSAVIVTPRAVHVITDRRFEAAAAKEVPWAKIHMRKGVLTEEIAIVCQKTRITSLAFQADRLTVASLDAIKKGAKGVKFVKAPGIVSQMRCCKDDAEVRLMQKAVKVAQDAFLVMRDSIRTDQTELEMAGLLEFEMRKRGASGPSFPTICAIGPNAANPHARCGNRKVKRGSAILFDWGALLGFYCSDLTRVLFMGRIPPRIGDIYRVVLDAQLAAVDAVKPGVRVCDVDDVARDLIAKAGYGDYFSHGLGHGLGLEVHEGPSVSWRSREELRPGMVITIEPGVYLDGVGGVRIEDDCLVTQRGCRVLSNLPKGISEAVL